MVRYSGGREENAKVLFAEGGVGGLEKFFATSLGLHAPKWVRLFALGVRLIYVCPPGSLKRVKYDILARLGRLPAHVY